MADAPDPNDPRDRMVDMLLRETLGNQEPPNLVGRIMRQADAYERSRKLRLVYTVMAAAAMIILCISGFILLKRTPSQNVAKDKPKIEEKKIEEKKVEEPKVEWARGNTVETGAESTVAVLGGYVHVEAAPNTRLKVEGQEKAEQIFLESGKLTCEVDKKIGSFSVRTPAGVVNVTGTKFNVRVPKPDGDHADAKPQQFILEVSEGSVQMSGEWGKESVRADGKGGSLVGTIVNRGDELAIRVDGEREPQHLLYALNAEHKVNRDQYNRVMGLQPGAKVQLGWVASKDGAREVHRIIGFEQIGTRTKEGDFQGVVTEKSDKNDWIRIRSENGVNERFALRWIGGQPAEGGGPDKRTQERVARLNKGDRVKLRWVMEEGPRLINIEKIGADGDKK